VDPLFSSFFHVALAFMPARHSTWHRRVVLRRAFRDEADLNNKVILVPSVLH